MNEEEWKIYTRKGDKGETSLLGGTRVPKYHLQIEAYGTLDELNSFIGLLRDQSIDEESRVFLIDIQDRIFTAESRLAADSEESLKTLPEITTADVDKLEWKIDEMNTELPPISSFVLPGGHPAVSYCHVSRTVCRRAERIIIKLAEKMMVDALVLKYLNRLSDYLFVLARKLTKDFHAVETPWKPNR